MKRRFTSRPSPGSSVLAAIVGGFMLIFALVFFSSVKLGPGPLNGPASAFFIVWVLGLIGVIFYHLVNATRRGGVPTTIIESEDVAPKSTTAERLQELESLHNQKLVSDAEYESKRQEILNGI